MRHSLRYKFRVGFEYLLCHNCHNCDTVEKFTSNCKIKSECLTWGKFQVTTVNTGFTYPTAKVNPNSLSSHWRSRVFGLLPSSRRSQRASHFWAGKKFRCQVLWLSLSTRDESYSVTKYGGATRREMSHADMQSRTCNGAFYELRRASRHADERFALLSASDPSPPAFS